MAVPLEIFFFNGRPLPPPPKPKLHGHLKKNGLQLPLLAVSTGRREDIFDEGVEGDVTKSFHDLLPEQVRSVFRYFLIALDQYDKIYTYMQCDPKTQKIAFFFK